MEAELFSQLAQGGGFSLMAYVSWETKKALDRNTEIIQKVLLKKMKKILIQIKLLRICFHMR